MKLSYKQYGKRLLILAFPIIMNNIIAQLQMIIDRIFLGHANDLYMSALGNVSSPVWTTMSFCNSLVMGASILIYQALHTLWHNVTSHNAPLINHITNS